MKLSAILLSIYVSILSCLACNDGIETISGTRADVSRTIHQPEKPDVCSPFCICSCCAGFVSLIFSTTPIKPRFIVLRTMDQFLVQSPKGISSSIFQPPRTI